MLLSASTVYHLASYRNDGVCRIKCEIAGCTESTCELDWDDQRQVINIYLSLHMSSYRKLSPFSTALGSRHQTMWITTILVRTHWCSTSPSLCLLWEFCWNGAWHGQETQVRIHLLLFLCISEIKFRNSNYITGSRSPCKAILLDPWCGASTRTRTRWSDWDMVTCRLRSSRFDILSI